ncbi:hypothetical protein JXA63_05440 [Candidatus Woesebacteria bacterium]|nr:hypothetical protein [Candidatus Woesebacteria bacterium]
MNELPIEHIHREKESQHATLVLMLLPAIVFFLTIAVLFLNHNSQTYKLSGKNEDSTVLGETGSNIYSR